jgi:pyruvate,water dikinase
VLVRLDEAFEEPRFGGKAVQLGAARRAGLPVPPGFALAHDDIDTPGKVDGLRADLAGALASLGGLVAARSSAIGEDSSTASFAGQHATLLGLRDLDGLMAAVDKIVASSRAAAALAYRQKLGLDLTPRMGVVVQALVRADVAGVLFSRHPIRGADERVIEATWGLGEAVVQGLITPDRYRMARGGAVLERAAGEKDLAVRWSDAGGTEEVEVEGDRVAALCLSDAMLADLERLTSRCEATFGGTQDLEFAFAEGRLYLLQRRAITRGQSRG